MGGGTRQTKGSLDFGGVKEKGNRGGRGKNRDADMLPEGKERKERKGGVSWPILLRKHLTMQAVTAGNLVWKGVLC